MPVVTSRYPAVVTNTDDPTRTGRIKVACAGIAGEEEGELPMWVEPIHDWGWFYVPDVGEQVEIECVLRGDHEDHPGQAFLENPDLRWRGKRFYGGTDAQSPQVATPVHVDLTETNYGKRRGLATPLGHTLYFDDTKDKPQIALTWRDKDGQTSQLLIDPDGSIFLFANDQKHEIHITQQGEFLASLVEGNHSLLISDADSKFELEVDKNGAPAHVTLDAQNKLLKIGLDSDNHFISLDGTTDDFAVSINGGAHVLDLDGASQKISVTIGNQNAIEVTGGGSAAIAQVGDGSDNAVKFTPFDILWNAIKTHTHSVPPAGIISSLGDVLTGAATAAPSTDLAPLTDTLCKANGLKIPST